MPIRRHQAMMQGVQERDDKFRAFKAQQLQADLARVRGRPASVPVVRAAIMEKLEVATSGCPLSPLHIIRSSRCLQTQSQDEWAQNVSEYALDLGEAVDKNRGLDHSKVREYWLQRGPRLLATACAFFVFTIICQEFLIKETLDRNRLYNFAVNSVALLIAFFLLYFRLQDSIDASVSRSAHDAYVSYKVGKMHGRGQSLDITSIDSSAPAESFDHRMDCVDIEMQQAGVEMHTPEDSACLKVVQSTLDSPSVEVTRTLERYLGDSGTSPSSCRTPETNTSTFQRV